MPPISVTTGGEHHARAQQRAEPLLERKVFVRVLRRHFRSYPLRQSLVEHLDRERDHDRP